MPLGAAVKLGAGDKAVGVLDFSQAAGHQDRPQPLKGQGALGFGQRGQFLRNKLAIGLLVVRQQANMSQGVLNDQMQGLR